VLIWPEWTPYFFDSSASVISSRIASSATRALNSAEWFFLFVVSDRLSNQSIYLNKWSEIPQPPLSKVVGCPRCRKSDATKGRKGTLPVLHQFADGRGLGPISAW
jgi:hypothetical protein